jgi:predicted Rossmann fold flavoprotein
MNSKDVIIIGAGPAGLMAAGQAASRGLSTAVLEKMPRPARKLRITGKGRCNLTNQADLKDFISHFGLQGRFLYPAFSKFFNSELVKFFEDLGVSTVTERGGRVFPTENQAQKIVDVLVSWAKECGAQIFTEQKVNRLRLEDNKVQGVEITAHSANQAKSSTQCFASKAVILATGGASYPATGSSGDGYQLAGSVGHTINPVRPHLVPLLTDAHIASRLAGLSLRNVQAKVLVDGKIKKQEFGEMLFTHSGVSGPIILSLSGFVVDSLAQNNAVSISLDLKPALEEDKLEARLIREFRSKGKQQFKNILKNLLPSALIPVCIEATQIQADKPGNQISAKERKGLLVWLKDFRLSITGHRPLEEAIITAGGVALKEVEPKSMASKLINGLFFAGEILDLQADTGGYNLQAAFSTGWLAGNCVLK